MTRDRLALLVTSSALLVSWLSAPASPTPEPAAAQPPAADAPPVGRDATAELAFDVVRETERLRQRVETAPGPRRSGRDPFAFGAAPRAVPRPARTIAPPPAADVPAVAERPSPAARPLLRLIGIAERQQDGALLRSAILSGTGDVYIVGVGDEVLGRFVVSAVDAGAVELSDSVTRASVRLALPD